MRSLRFWDRAECDMGPPLEPQERGLGEIGVPDQQRRLGLARRKREIEGCGWTRYHAVHFVVTRERGRILAGLAVTQREEGESFEGRAGLVSWGKAH